MIRGTYHLTKLGIQQDRTRTLIQRRRLQIMVHSVIYYRFGTSLVTDQTFDNWCRQLVRLQAKYPKIAKHAPYAKDFENFTGVTGFDLCYRPEIIAKAKKILEVSKDV